MTVKNLDHFNIRASESLLEELREFYCDLIGLSDEKPARFVKQYGEVGGAIRDAIRAFADDVRGGDYPDRNHGYGAKREG